MHESVERVQRQISELGGQLSAEVLGNFFRQNEQPFGEEFYPERMLRDIWTRMFGERQRSRDNYDEPVIGSQNAGMSPSGGYNVIPAPPGPGGCAKLCVTFVDELWDVRFRPRHQYRHSMELLREAMLLQAKYWLDCHNINEENLIFVTNWYQRSFEVSVKGLVDAYITGYSKKVFIVEVTRSGPFLRYPY